MRQEAANPASKSSDHGGSEARTCFHCNDPSHVMRDCPKAAELKSRGERPTMRFIPEWLKKKHAASRKEGQSTGAEHSFATVEDERDEDEQQQANSASEGTFVPQSHHGVMDSGATSHFTGRDDKLFDQEPINPIRVSTIVGDRIVKMKGSMKMNSRIKLNNVKFLKNATFSLISIVQICDADYVVLFTKTAAYVLPLSAIVESTLKNLSIFTVPRRGKLWAYVIGGGDEPQEQEVNFKYSSRSSSGMNKKSGGSSRIPKRTDATTSSSSANVTVESDEEEAETNSVTVADIGATTIEDGYSAEANSPQDMDQDFAGSAAEANKQEIQDEQSNVDFRVVDAETQTSDEVNMAALWHAKLGHASKAKLRTANELYDLSLTNDEIEQATDQCGVCIKCKSQRKAIRAKTARRSRVARKAMDCWHVDLCGPYSLVEEGKRFRLPSVHGDSYNLTVVDEYSRHAMVTNLKTKSQAADAIIWLIKKKQNALGRKLVRLHGDGGGEFLNSKLEAFLKENGTELTTTPPNTPAYNNIAERMWRTLREYASCLLVHADAPHGQR